jgi:hypothetical protein
VSDLQDLIHTNAHNAYEIGVRTERERIIQIAKRNICFDHLQTKTCDHGGCYALDLLIGKVNE